MKYHPIKLFGIAALLVVSSCAQKYGAKVDLMDSAGKKIGQASLIQIADGVALSVQAEGLSPGSHGIHIHESGSCIAPDFKSAGGHFNPTNKQHGIQNPEGAHGGDMPNLVVDADGKAKMQFTLPDLTIQEGNLSLIKSGGTALVIHAGADDGKTNPSGNSGDRIACGVIVKK